MYASSFAQHPIVVTGGTLIDGTGGPPLQDAVIVINGKSISQVGTKKSIQIPQDAEIIHADGKYIIPGLIDCHIHYERLRNLVQLLAWGITSANCMFESTDQALAMEKMTSNDTIHSPQIYATAPIFTTIGGWWQGEGFPIDSTINRFPTSPEEAREQVRKAKAKGIKRIKLMYDDMGWCRDPLPRLVKMNPKIMTALVNEAEKEGLMYEVHAPQIKDAKEVRDSVSNPRGLAFAHSIVDQNIGNDIEIAGSSVYASFGIEVTGLFYVPTFCVFQFLADTKGFMEHALSDERFRSALAPQIIQQYTSEEYYLHYAEHYPNIKFVKSHLSTLENNLKNIFGDRVAMGTDMWAFPGIGAHLEMEYMVEAGMSTSQVLAAATNDAANFLGAGKHKLPKPARITGNDTKEINQLKREELGLIGTIEEGKQADLLILDANPLDDIQNTRSVRTIIKHGVIFDHQQLIEESKRQ
jgi:imidazolonepropionase-like amidohydrolase